MSAPTKIARVLEHLARGRSLNRFEAERQLHDHVLPTTIARIQTYGIYVDRRIEQVSGFEGHPTHVARYRIPLKADRDKAREVLKAMGTRRAQAEA